jgi:hypothetical protein
VGGRHRSGRRPCCVVLPMETFAKEAVVAWDSTAAWVEDAEE